MKINEHEYHRPAVIIVDMWSEHWARGAKKRMDKLAPRIDRFLEWSRDTHQCKVIHAPSTCIGKYPNRPVLPEGSKIKAPTEQTQILSGLPIPHADHADRSDTNEPRGDGSVFTHQHESINILESDVVSDDPNEIYSWLKLWECDALIYVGVHVNQCLIKRPFGMQRAVHWGLQTYLVRDLTDAMYNPKDPPWVSQREGTQICIDHIDRVLCPVVWSGDIR